jgi:chromosome segregation ATPase
MPPRKKNVSRVAQSKARMIMAQLQSLEGLSGLRGELAELDEMVDELTRRYGSADNRLTVLEAHDVGVQKEVSALSTAVHKLVERMNNQGAINTQLKAEVERVIDLNGKVAMAHAAKDGEAFEHKNDKYKALADNEALRLRHRQAIEILESATTLHAAQAALKALRPDGS